MFFYYYNSPIGRLRIVQNHKGICQIVLPNTEIEVNATEKLTPIIEKTITQLKEYFQGERKNFDVPLSLKGTDFQLKVWRELMKIPYGHTICYSELAEKIGNSKAQRAVGMANNRNPVPIIVPCHRVVGKNGNLTGYGGGLDIKAKLLKLEKDNM